ncbi:MAG: GTP-binding protein [archaeon]|nr:GTP-binding protein [archaeon]
MVFINPSRYDSIVMQETFVKILICGDGGVGKTSLLNRYVNDEFAEDSEMTKGVNFFSKKVKNSGKSFECELVLWDLGGQEQFKFLLSQCIDGAAGALFLFDMTRFNSLDRIDEWMEQLSEHGNIPIMLVGTKCDLTDLISDSLDEYASQIVQNCAHCVGYIKTSAKTNYNIQDTFELFVEILEKRREGYNSDSSSFGETSV